jgi:hypothetical protein
MVQPPSDEQPQQPSFGGQPPPYDPAQSPYGQQSGQLPQYGQPEPPYGPPPPKQGNGFAIAGIILAIFAPLLGLIFSIIGLNKSKARAGAGRALSIAGIIVSVIVMAGGGALVAVLANSTAADPGCVSAESASRQMQSTLSADAAAMNRDQNSSSALQADLQHFLNDMQALQGRMTAADAQAQHQSVKAQISAVISDMGTFDSSLQGIAQGNTSLVSQMQTSGNKLQSDGNALDSTCSSL